MDSKLIEKLFAETRMSLDTFKSTGSESSRVDAHDKALKLARVLERPRDAILKLSFSPTILMAVKAAHDMKLFSVLAQATAPVSLTELAAAKPADPQLVERMMRVLVANDFAEEAAAYEYLPTARSKEMTQRTSIGVVESLFGEFLPSIQKTPEYLQATNYRNPDDPFYAPLQYTNQIDTDGFAWLCQNPDALSRFNSFMEGQRANRPHWGDWFPVQERLLDGCGLSADDPLLVDIGGGRGHDLIAFRERFPNAPGKLVLEDLPGVIDEVRRTQDLDAGKIEAVSYDFFAQVQPVQGARAYFFKYIMHDWSDEKASIILNHLKPAMKRGYSKILIEEYILPDRDASIVPCMTDLAVMVFCSGLERTRQRWRALLESNGLQVVKFWTRDGDELGVIEAELADGNGQL